jgi:hypothetical protein
MFTLRDAGECAGEWRSIADGPLMRAVSDPTGSEAVRISA